MYTRLAAGLAVALVALFALPACVQADGCTFRAERHASIDAAGAVRVEIMARAGTLSIQPAPGSLVDAHGTACASREEYLAQTQVHARRRGEVVQVYVQVPEAVASVGVFHASLDLAVQVPPNVPLHVTDTSGDATIEKVHLARLTDSSGDIVLRGLLADVEIDDSSGDIRVGNAAGLVKVTDSSGGIFVDGARDVLVPSDSSGGIEIRRVSGSVRIENDSSGDIAITDVGRDVEVLADSSGDIQVSDTRGQVRLPPR